MDVAQTQVPLPFQFDAGEPWAPSRDLLTLQASGSPVHQIMMPSNLPAWVVTRWQDVRTVLDNPALFSSVSPPIPIERPPSCDGIVDALPQLPSFFVTSDPPIHTHFRHILAPYFSVRRLRSLEGSIRKTVERALSEMIDLGPPLDFVRFFGTRVPTEVISDFLGLPEDVRTTLARLVAETEDLSVSHQELRRTFIHIVAICHDVVVRQRRVPGDGLLGDLIRDHGKELTDEDILGMISMVFSAGYSPTANLFALAALLMMLLPEQQTHLLSEDRSRAVEELIRHLTVIRVGQVRTVMKPVELSGQLLKPGEYVLCALGPANRDPELLPDGPELNLARPRPAHVAFGHGPHQCLGQHLVRIETGVALPMLFSRLPNIRPAMPVEKLRFRVNSPVNSLSSLPVSW